MPDGELANKRARARAADPAPGLPTLSPLVGAAWDGVPGQGTAGWSGEGWRGVPCSRETARPGRANRTGSDG